ncbi:MAG: rRNA pseudouridine synthase [Planctomycetaceae bacterium]|nr:rRNA pseudouridine synthase [Planctomycetaceae bacterium]
MKSLRSDSLPPFRTRLHKFLASAGVASRRQCEELMLQGRVTVDGEEIRDLAYMVEPARQTVKVDGSVVREQPKHYYVINKPTGYVCTHHDPEGRPKAIDLCPIQGLALFTIGRLDEDSEGLLLVTNDGQMAEKLAHPRFKSERTYRVQVSGTPTAEALEQCKRGMYFEEGKFRFYKVRVLKGSSRNATLEIVLTEGKNREIRRVLARLGHKVLSLQRVAFGPIRLGSLPLGEFRVLGAKEVVELKAYAGERRLKRAARKFGEAVPQPAEGVPPRRPRPVAGAGYSQEGREGSRAPRRPAGNRPAGGDRPRGRRTYSTGPGGGGYGQGGGQGDRPQGTGRSNRVRRGASRPPLEQQGEGRRTDGPRPYRPRTGGYRPAVPGQRRPEGQARYQGGQGQQGGQNRPRPVRKPFRKRRPEDGGPQHERELPPEE